MPTICLELKPKCGFLPTSPCIHPGHSIKLRVPRFQLHQQLKLAQVSCSSMHTLQYQARQHSMATCSMTIAAL